MIDPSAFVQALKNTGIKSFTGVPCSYLKSLITVLGGDDDYVAAASEGEAIGIAAGSYLTGNPPAVLIQSSGLGNCVNPLTSLTAPFELPMLLIVGYRNADGKGPPQHNMMGEIAEPLLELMDIKHATLEPEFDRACAQLQDLLTVSRETKKSVALLVRDKTFEAALPNLSAIPRRTMTCQTHLGPSNSQAPLPRIEALKAIGESLGKDDVVIATTGMTSRELFTIGDRPGNFYMVGSMGCAIGMGLGIALKMPERRVIVIDGDGALLMKLGSLATVGHYQPQNLFHIVLDNGTYESTGSQPTTATTTSFPKLAEAAGYAQAISAHHPSDITHNLAKLQLKQGPSLLHLPIADGHLDGVGRVPPDLPELAQRLMLTLRESDAHSAVG